jgi:hypothetical protein
MLIHKDITQGSDEWFNVKAGKFSASNFSKLFSGKSTDSYKGIINKVVFERLSGKPIDSADTYKSPAMQRGNDLEPFARQNYELQTFNLVDEVGFIEVNDYVGVSPDGLIDKNGGLEIKCLEYNAFIEFVTTQKIKTEYKWQIQGSLWASEREWWDFYVYHPDLESKPLRVYRDEPEIKKLETELDIAIETVQQKLDLLKED